MRIASGLLSMTGAQLTQAVQDGNALDADWLKVAGSVLLNSAPDQGTASPPRARYRSQAHK
jgi:hypothetical protein